MHKNLLNCAFYQSLGCHPFPTFLLGRVCLSLSTLDSFNPQITDYNIIVTTQLEREHRRDLVHNHTSSSTSPVLDHVAFVLACSTSMLTPVSVLVKTVSFTQCGISRHNEWFIFLKPL